MITCELFVPQSVKIDPFAWAKDRGFHIWRFSAPGSVWYINGIRDTASEDLVFGYTAYWDGIIEVSLSNYLGKIV